MRSNAQSVPHYSPYSGAARTHHGRRGMTALIAMLFMVLFGIMALGFYSSVTTAVAVSANEQKNARATLAAESGMAFIRFHLANLEVPPATPEAELFQKVYERLGARLNNYPNMGTNTVGINVAADTITIPGGADKFIAGDTMGSRFKVEITKQDNGRKLRVKVRGRFGNVESQQRAVQMDYAVTSNPKDVLKFGVATRSIITMNANAKIIGNPAALGSVLSTSAAAPTVSLLGSTNTISGGVSFTSTAAQLVVAPGSSVGGTVVKGVANPEFPTVNTDVFKTYAGNPLYGGFTVDTPGQTYATGTLKNVLVKANTNPIFDSNLKIDGVLYIETPNQVQFLSNVEIRGAVVTQTPPTGTIAQNTMLFDSNAKIFPIETLPATTDFPPALRALTGAAILAPKFAVTVNSNFGSTGGSIIAGRLRFDSNASGTVKGSVIGLENLPMTMGSNALVNVASANGADSAGVYFGSHYTPLADTYTEATP